MDTKSRNNARLSSCKGFDVVPVTGLGAAHHKSFYSRLAGSGENPLAIGGERRGLQMAMRIEKGHGAMIDYHHDTRNPFGPRYLAPELQPR